MGTVGLIGSDDILACFIAGNSFTWDDWFRIETEKAHLMEVRIMISFWPILVQKTEKSCCNMHTNHICVSS